MPRGSPTGPLTASGKRKARRHLQERVDAELAGKICSAETSKGKICGRIVNETGFCTFHDPDYHAAAVDRIRAFNQQRLADIRAKKAQMHAARRVTISLLDEVKKRLWFDQDTQECVGCRSTAQDQHYNNCPYHLLNYWLVELEKLGG